MIKFLSVILTLFVSGVLFGQYESGISRPDKTKEVVKSFKDDAYLVSTTINEIDLKDHLSVLSSDHFEGRETGTPGIELASDYLASFFSKLDLPKIGDHDSYFQEVIISYTSWKKMDIKSEGTTFHYLKDFLAFPQYSEEFTSINSDEIVFNGYGIESEAYSDYDADDLRGKVLMVFDAEPVNEDGISIITGTTEKSEWSKDWTLKSKLARHKGARLLFIVSNDLKSMINKNRRFLVSLITELGDKTSYVPEGVNTIFISSGMAETLLGDRVDDVIQMRNRLRISNQPMEDIPVSTDLNVIQVKSVEVMKGKNVLAYIEGTEKKDELVIVSAHYDHVGHKGSSIYNGADDNGSGTSTVLEIAEALATAKKLGKGPKRSVLCILFTGEEKGLLGSDYYVNNPIFPLANTLANVNIDMVGRRGSLYEGTDEPYIYIIGSDRLSRDLHAANEKVNQKYSQLILDYKYNDKEDPNKYYYRSDHYNFAKKGIPSIFYFNGTHADYHRPTDTIDKIDFNLMKMRARHIFHLIWHLSNAGQRIEVLTDISMN